MPEKTNTKKAIHVAAGIVLRGDLVFVTKRAADVHQGGKWEFPGGKVQLNESASDALCRELSEEIGITITNPKLYHTIEHDYPDKTIKLDFFLVGEFDGEPQGCEGQLGQWLSKSALATLDFPAANQALIAQLINMA
ncbi:MAG: 8-oxo-dGTP diphosphatase [Phenylobacterium sp.]|jgi:8-oxo-dGTP diphosphatase